MRIPRIFQSLPLAGGQVLELDAQATVHLTRVLRLKTGDSLRVFNGEGGEFEARLVEVGRRSARIEVGAFLAREVESPLELVLAQGVSRGERMDYTVQKAVELGVLRIIPVLTERTAVNLRDDRGEKRQMHWQAVVNGACEQSGRNQVPVVEPVMNFASFMDAVPGFGAEAVKFVLHHRAETSLHSLARPQGPVYLLIGPEGGLSPAEITAATAVGFLPLRLGPRVLRTETAALAAMSVLQWLWGDFT